MTAQDPRDEELPDLPPKLAQWALRSCSDCARPRYCKNELLFFPDLGVSRVFYCPDHGVVSIAEVVSTRR